MRIFITGIFVVYFQVLLYGQCTNTIQWPSESIAVSAFNDTVIVGTDIFAGDYSIVDQLSVGETYVFSSSNSSDYITLRNPYDPSILIAHGMTPLSYTPVAVDILAVHYNLSSPACGTEFNFRTITLQCSLCPDLPPSIGINTIEPESTLDIAGEIKVGDSGRAPKAGMIRWNDNRLDFEGYNGEKWMSLTTSNQKNQWGKVPNTKMVPDERLISDDGSLGSNFGFSVGISGQYAIIGAPFQNVGSNVDQGQAYIFKYENDSWSLMAILVADDGQQLDQFGFSVAIDGDYVIEGAPKTFEFAVGPGAAYIFHREGDSWIQQSKLLANDGSIDDLFGTSVDIAGAYCVVGAYLDDIGSNNVGSVYVYNRNGTTWSQQSKLTANDATFGDNLGFSVSISGNYIAAGAPGDAGNQGSVYIFTRFGSAWSQNNKLIATDGVANDYFGGSVSVQNNQLLIGASADDFETNNAQGSAYIFVRSGNVWTEQIKLTAKDGNAEGKFGSSVAIHDDYAIVGSIFHDIDNAQNQGAAYLYQKNGSTWELQSKFCANDGQQEDHFGNSVDISSEVSIVGANNDDIEAIQSQGSSYIISKK